jgi:uncharacterized protein
MSRLASLLFIVPLYYVIQWLTQVLAIYPHLGLPAHLTQPGGWVRGFDHHFWQLVLALVAIGLLGRGRWRAWGLNLRNGDESLRLFGRFCWYYGVYFVGIGVVFQWLFLPPPALDHEPTLVNVVGRLAFGFLFAGLSEEIRFRGLVHTWLAGYWTGVWRWGDRQMPVAGIVATIIFTVAHIGFRLDPFQITHLRPLQLVQAFVLGLFYSAVYHRTGSLLAPVLAHNFSNGSLWVGEYVVYWLGRG